jgi:hypothetical protein
MYLILNISGNLKFGKSKLYDWQAKQTKCIIDDIYKEILLETPYILVQKPNSHHKLSSHGCGSTCETGPLLARETYLACMMNGGGCSVQHPFHSHSSIDHLQLLCLVATPLHHQIVFQHFQTKKTIFVPKRVLAILKLVFFLCCDGIIFKYLNYFS